MSSKSISFRIEEDLKREADEVLKDIGLNMSAALTMFLQQVVNKRSIPFIPEASDSFYSRENMAVLENRIKEYEAGQLEQHDLIEVD